MKFVNLAYLCMLLLLQISLTGSPSIVTWGTLGGFAKEEAVAHVEGLQKQATPGFLMSLGHNKRIMERNYYETNLEGSLRQAGWSWKSFRVLKLGKFKRIWVDVSQVGLYREKHQSQGWQLWNVLLLSCPRSESQKILKTQQHPATQWIFVEKLKQQFWAHLFSIFFRWLQMGTSPLHRQNKYRSHRFPLLWDLSPWPSCPHSCTLLKVPSCWVNSHEDQPEGVRCQEWHRLERSPKAWVFLFSYKPLIFAELIAWFVDMPQLNLLGIWTKQIRTTAGMVGQRIGDKF